MVFRLGWVFRGGHVASDLVSSKTYEQIMSLRLLVAATAVATAAAEAVQLTKANCKSSDNDISEWMDIQSAMSATHRHLTELKGIYTQ